MRKPINWEKLFWQGLGVVMAIGVILTEHYYFHEPWWHHYTLPQ